MNFPAKTVERIIDALNAAETVCIIGHVRPDGDCVGSQVALAMALQDLGKQVVCWNEDPLPAKLAFLDTRKLFQRPKSGMKFDVVVATDAASLERTGKVAGLVTERGLFINIDHHASNTRFADLNWVSEEEPSTGEIIYRLLRTARWPVTAEIANCLFTAVSTDTGSFQYPSTLPSTYHVGGELVERGADLSKICYEVYQSHPLSRVRLLRHLYSHFKLTHDDRIAYLWLRKADFDRARAETCESEGLIDHIRDIEPVVVACIFEEIGPELVRVSFRSKSEKVDVNQIAGQFGGGGHRAAAGARIQGRPMSVQRRVVAAIRKAINAAAKS